MVSALAWQVPLLILLICLSALFSGLTLGLLSLDLTDLRVAIDSGSEQEKKYAQRILPVRQRGNQLLVSLLIGNTAVNSAISIISADLFTGVIGFLLSTTFILYLGEIIPQSLCHKFGMQIGYYTVPLVIILMIITWPIAWPTALALNKVLGPEEELRYTRKQIKSLVTLHGTVDDEQDEDLEKIMELGRSADQFEEFENQERIGNGEKSHKESIHEENGNGSVVKSHSISHFKEKDKKNQLQIQAVKGFTKDETRVLGSALEFWEKQVYEIMTPLERVFMLELNEVLDFETMKAVFQCGHSRLPVYSEDRSNIQGVIFAKDLILVDPDDEIPVKTLLSFFGRELQFVLHNSTLGFMLNRFRSGKGHMALVKKLIKVSPNNAETNYNDRNMNAELKGGRADPFYETIGVVTLEDVIEELIGAEILDETDIYFDNTSRQRVDRKGRKIDAAILKMFDSEARDTHALTKNERRAITTFLIHNTSEFEGVREQVLRKILKNLVPENHADYGQASKLAVMLPAGLAEDIISMDGTVTKRGQRNKHISVIRRGEPLDNAVLLLQGKLKITAGEEGFVSEAGPWTVLARGALSPREVGQEEYVPDFSAESLELPLRFLRISRDNYEIMVRLSANIPVGDGNEDRNHYNDDSDDDNGSMKEGEEAEREKRKEEERREEAEELRDDERFINEHYGTLNDEE